MPTLDWIGKSAVVNHHVQVPYRLLHCNGERSTGAADEGNLLVENDFEKARRGAAIALWP